MIVIFFVAEVNHLETAVCKHRLIYMQNEFVSISTSSDVKRSYMHTFEYYIQNSEHSELRTASEESGLVIKKSKT